MKQILALLALLGVTAQIIADSPTACVAAAVADIVKQPLDDRPYIWYMATYAVPKVKREKFNKGLNFHVHCLSRGSELYPPRQVTDFLVAVDIRNYEWDAQVWERLKDVDPHFHILQLNPARTVDLKDGYKDWPGGVWPLDNKYYPPGSFTYRDIGGAKTADPLAGKKGIQAPWLNATEILELMKWTKTEVPIVRADWFIYQTAIQEKRVAGYYDFLNIKDLAAFKKLGGVDVELSKGAKQEMAAIMAVSGVTVENRSILRFAGATGSYWVTQDFEDSTGRKNVLNALDQDLDPVQGDASEQYIFLPNGLLAFFLVNKDFKRQNVAPPFIASDKESKSNDTQVHIGLSCIRCHAEGIRPIDDYARQIYDGTNELGTTNKKDFRRFKQLYLSNLQAKITEDQTKYAKRLFELNGLKPAEMAKLYGEIWYDYADAQLTKDAYARELGMDTKFMVDALRAYSAPKKNGTVEFLPGSLAPLTRDKGIQTILRKHADEGFSFVQEKVRGYRP